MYIFHFLAKYINKELCFTIISERRFLLFMSFFKNLIQSLFQDEIDSDSSFVLPEVNPEAENKLQPEDLLKKYILQTIRIPMREHLRSLNLSNSVAIVAYEVLRQVGFEKLEEISSYFD